MSHMSEIACVPELHLDRLRYMYTTHNTWNFFFRRPWGSNMSTSGAAMTSVFDHDKKGYYSFPASGLGRSLNM